MKLHPTPVHDVPMGLNPHGTHVESAYVEHTPASTSPLGHDVVQFTHPVPLSHEPEAQTHSLPPALSVPESHVKLQPTPVHDVPMGLNPHGTHAASAYVVHGPATISPSGHDSVHVVQPLPLSHDPEPHTQSLPPALSVPESHVKLQPTPVHDVPIGLKLHGTHVASAYVEHTPASTSPLGHDVVQLTHPVPLSHEPEPHTQSLPLALSVPESHVKLQPTPVHDVPMGLNPHGTHAASAYVVHGPATISPSGHDAVHVVHPVPLSHDPEPHTQSLPPALSVPESHVKLQPTPVHDVPIGLKLHGTHVASAYVEHTPASTSPLGHDVVQLTHPVPLSHEPEPHTQSLPPALSVPESHVKLQPIPVHDVPMGLNPHGTHVESAYVVHGPATISPSGHDAVHVVQPLPLSHEPEAQTQSLPPVLSVPESHVKLQPTPVHDVPMGLNPHGTHVESAYVEHTPASTSPLGHDVVQLTHPVPLSHEPEPHTHSLPPALSVPESHVKLQPTPVHDVPIGLKLHGTHIASAYVEHSPARISPLRHELVHAVQPLPLQPRAFIADTLRLPSAETSNITRKGAPHPCPRRPYWFDAARNAEHIPVRAAQPRQHLPTCTRRPARGARSSAPIPAGRAHDGPHRARRPVPHPACTARH